MNGNGSDGLVADTHHSYTVASITKIESFSLLGNIRNQLINCEFLKPLVDRFSTVQCVFVGSPTIAFGVPSPAEL